MPGPLTRSHCQDAGQDRVSEALGNRIRWRTSRFCRWPGRRMYLIVALNAPPELARKIAQGEPLTAEEKAMVPTGFVATAKGYRNFVAMMGGHPGMNETDQRRFFDAQNIWDQTMASRILEFKRRNPKVLLVVLTGRGHVSGGYGIPFYVRQKASLKQSILPRQISKLQTDI